MVYAGAVANDNAVWLELLERRITEAKDERESQGADVRELRALLAQLVDILKNRGDLSEGHTRLLQKISSRARRPSKPIIRLSPAQDKYQ